MEKLEKIVSFLDKELNISSYQDSSNNGLQVESKGRIKKICCGVDASMEFFGAALHRSADMVVCHHGISWGDSLKYITDINYSRLSFLINNDIALYACHLPLDAHPRYGNNILICKALGLHKIQSFGEYNGFPIGFKGVLPRSVSYESFKKKVAKVTAGKLQTMDFGPGKIRSVAVVSGGAADGVMEAGLAGIDVYLSGEPKLSAYSVAQEQGINAVFAGHYATEVFGVRALAGVLEKKFNVKAEFIDLGIRF